MAVAYEVTEVVVRPTPRHARAAVTVNDDVVRNVSGSKALPLAVGSTATTVEVTAEDEAVGTYEIEWTRAARPEQVEVRADGFRLRCRSWVLEGMEPECDLTNTNSGSRDWPVVAVLHSSADSHRALVARDSSNADDASFVRDVRITGGNKQAGYNYGYGELFSGESRSGQAGLRVREVRLGRRRKAESGTARARGGHRRQPSRYRLRDLSYGAGAERLQRAVGTG